MRFGRPERGIGGRSWHARMGREGRAKVRRKLIIQTHPRESDICYANHCFFRVLSPVETFCVNGRARATARRRFSLTFPGNDEPRVGAFAHDFAPTSSIRGRGSVPPMRTLTRRLGRPGSASASRHRQCTQQAQHAEVSEDASHVGIGASQLLRLGSWRRGSRRHGWRRRGSGRAPHRGCRRGRRGRRSV